MSSLLLNIRNLCISFPSSGGSFEAVRGMDLQLARGEIAAIVGESGSGKSVSMLSLGRLLPEHAQVQADTLHYYQSDLVIDLLRCSAADMRHLRQTSIAYVFQEPMSALHPLFPCGDQVIEGIVHAGIAKRKEAKKKAMALFDELRLPDPQRVYEAYPHQLSGGQRQRVMLAMALMADPELVIADEPTTALDSVLQRAVVEIMVDACRKRNTGLILISHDIHVVRDYTDKTLVMYRGKLLETGPTAEVMKQPQHPYTKALIACRPTFKQRDTKLPTIEKLLKTEDGNMVELPYEPEAYPVHQRSDKVLCRLSGIEVSYPGKKRYQALRNLNMELLAGETLGIVGESGSGKSTMAKLLTGLIKPDCGTLDYEFGPIRDRRKFAQKVQMIFQDPYASLNPNLTVMQALTEVMKVHRHGAKDERAGRVFQLLEEVGLRREDAFKYPHEFSGGQRQRISIARALAAEPEIMVCDESVSALDVSVQAQILNLLKGLQEQRKLTYLFITHDLDVVSYISDQLLVLRHGEVVESGRTRDLIEDPKTDYCRDLFAQVRLQNHMHD